MGMLKNLLQGNLAIHQEMINKFLKKLIEESNTFLNKLNISLLKVC